MSTATSASRSHRQVVEDYYRNLFCHPCSQDVERKAADLVDSNWSCTPEPIGGPGLTGLADTVRFLSTFAPDLKYDPQEIIEAGNKVIVRSVVTGTPTKPFLGVEPKRSFRINAVDIHEVVNGKIVKTFRVEDWARAIKQIA